MLLFYPIITMLVSALVTVISMPLLLRFCQERGLFDMPNERKVHHNKIPLLGGVLFAPATVIGIGVSILVMMALKDNWLPSMAEPALFLFFGMFLIYIIGLLDDILGLDAKIKFGTQLVASFFMPFCHLYINNLYGFCGIYEISTWVGYPLTILLSLLIINAFNLIDGIDGLASGLGIIALGVYSYLFASLGSVVFTVFAMGLFGTMMAFMYFNLFGNAEKFTKTFMGDTGSLILGYSITYLSIKYSMYNPQVFPVQSCPILVAYTLVLVPVLDLIRVAIERVSIGKGMFTPDKRHIHHLCMAAGMSMHKALAFILSLQFAFDLLNLALFKYLSVPTTLIVLLNVAVYVLVVILLKKRNV